MKCERCSIEGKAYSADYVEYIPPTTGEEGPTVSIPRRVLVCWGCYIELGRVMKRWMEREDPARKTFRGAVAAKVREAMRVRGATGGIGKDKFHNLLGFLAAAEMLGVITNEEKKDAHRAVIDGECAPWWMV